MSIQKIHIIDSHTGGEPTRVVVSGGPDLGTGTVAERCAVFQKEFDRYRSAIVNEPRGSDVMVGALLTTSQDTSCAAGVIFFNNAGYLGMCGHGTIGLITTLASMRKIVPGTHSIETPVGIVKAELHKSGEVSVQNIACGRLAKDVCLEVKGYGRVTGDIAWGGNWFFLISEHGQQIELVNVEKLTAFAWQVRQSLERAGITGTLGAVIDHIELFAPSKLPGVHSKNFVLCPGKAYDRSPCGTGVSAKLACLFADGKLGEGDIWRQESIIGSVFEGSVTMIGDDLVPTIKGKAYITGEANLILNSEDPYNWGIR